MQTFVLFDIDLEVLARAIRQKWRSRGFKLVRKKVKLSLFADDILVYMSDPENSTREFLQLIHTLSCYKINSKKSVALL